MKDLVKNKTNQPKVSVVIPFYNKISYTTESIKSVFAQSYNNWELLLVNDGSTEDITPIVQLINEDAKVRILTQENKGVSAARNLGIKNASGKYVAFLDSDDLWVENKLEIQIEYMEKRHCWFSHTSYRRIKSDGTLLEKIPSGLQCGEIYPQLMSNCGIATPTVMVKREVFEGRETPFPVNFHIDEDICLWIDISAEHCVGGINKALTLVRIGETTAALDPEKQATGLRNILNYVEANPKYRAELEQTDRLRQMIYEMKVEAKDNPLVSIVIPVYNGANYMREAIDSALAQTYPNIEVLVINDGSNDNGETERIAYSYGDRIRYFSKENGGVATALNLGIQKMEGEYFSWLSHDDMYTPTKIEEEIRWLRVQSDPTTIIAEGYQVVDSTGKYMYKVNLHERYTSAELRNALFVLLHGGINGCALLIHRSHFERVGVFDTTLPTTQDYDLWFRMFRGQKVFYAKTQNVLSRSHEEQGSKALLEEHVAECDKLWIGIMDSLTVEEKEQLSGSEYEFYRDIEKFLREATGYKAATQYALEKYLHTLVMAYKQCPKRKLRQEICKTCGYEPQFLEHALLLHEKGNKKRVLFYLEDRYDSGGLNRVVLQVAGLLVERFDVIVTSSSPFDEDGYPTPQGVTDLRLPWGSWSSGIAQKISCLCLFLSVDVLVCSYNCVSETLGIYEVAQRFGIHTIAWNHENYFVPYLDSKLHGCLERRNEKIGHADAAVWLNNRSAALYGAFQSNGFRLLNPNPFEGMQRIKGEVTKDIVAVARFDDPRKGLEPLLRMFGEVLQERPETILYVVGSYDLDLPLPSEPRSNYRELIRRLMIPKENLQFTGIVTNVADYYENACINVLPSVNEGFGLVLLEAATLGLPSVVFEGSGMDDIIDNGLNGFTVPQGDWKALAQCIIGLLDNDDKLQKMSEAAREMTHRFSTQKVKAAWETVIMAVLGDEESGLRLDEYRVAEPEEVLKANVMQLMRSYEDCISNMTKRVATVSSTQQHIYTPVADSVWERECFLMQQSFSWRITKPLRLTKKALVVWKQEGFGVLVRKVWQKLRKK